MDYDTLLPKEFGEELHRAPVAYLPWGALEWHGRHLPLGLDGLKAHALCRLTAERAGGVVLPPVWSGYETLALNGFDHTLEFDRELVMALLRAYLGQLGRVGFRLVVVLTGHYGIEHVAALAEAADTFARSDGGRDTAVWVLPEYELARDLGYHGDHAARWETSILMHLRPELVDLGRLDDRTASEGIFGEDPRTTATRELGQSVTDRVVANLAQRIQHFLGA